MLALDQRHLMNTYSIIAGPSDGQVSEGRPTTARVAWPARTRATGVRAGSQLIVLWRIILPLASFLTLASF